MVVDYEDNEVSVLLSLVNELANLRTVSYGSVHRRAKLISS